MDRMVWYTKSFKFEDSLSLYQEAMRDLSRIWGIYSLNDELMPGK